jgi:DNA modification methylase
MMKWFIERFDDGNVITDPFLGSGTTLLTAHELSSARVIGAEIQPEFCEEVLARYTELSGENPKVSE